MSDRVYLDVSGSKGFTYIQSLQSRIDSGYGTKYARTALHKIEKTRQRPEGTSRATHVSLTPKESEELHEALEGIFSDDPLDISVPSGTTLGWGQSGKTFPAFKNPDKRTPYPKPEEYED
jgi:hypothetical protein